MTNNTEKQLQVNESYITIWKIDERWWIPLKPICDVLNIDYQAQHKAVLSDDILGQLSSNQTIVAADGRMRNMVCLPEKYVYGWLFSINSNSEELKKYKRKCYDILYNYFHQQMNGRV